MNPRTCVPFSGTTRGGWGLTNVRLFLVNVALFALGCGAQGVSLGSEELCQLDPRVAAARERPGSPEVTACATVGQNRLVNAGFETPPVGLVADCASDFCQVPAAQVSGWRTTSEAQVIELWTDGYTDVPAPAEKQFAELDADTADTLYQDLVLTPGELVYWSVLHRGRAAVETMEVFLGSPESPASQALVTTSTDDWKVYRGLYRVPDDEAVTRFALTSRTGTSEGNLVDDAVLAPLEVPK